MEKLLKKYREKYKKHLVECWEKRDKLRMEMVEEFEILLDDLRENLEEDFNAALTYDVLDDFLKEDFKRKD